MTRIAIDPPSLRRTAGAITEVCHEYLAIVRELDLLTQNFPQMSPEYRSTIRAGVESVMEDLARLVIAHDPDVAAMKMAAEIIERDESRALRTVVGRSLSILRMSYSIVDEVYDTARKYGIGLDEAAELVDGGAVTRELVRVLGVEGTVSPAVMKRLTRVGGWGLDFIEEYGFADGSLWEATQRTLISSGSGMLVAINLARGCSRFIKSPVTKGACGLIGGVLGESAGDRLNEKIFGKKRFTPEEREQVRAASYPSGLTPQQEAERLDDAREGFERARRELISELVAEGETREEAERIAELTFPEYLLLTP